MPRPRKWRKVCGLPNCSRFGPVNCQLDDANAVIMSIEEYETIRLLDLEGLTQEECAGHMNVARTTVQGIYDSARRKFADSLVNGKLLWIEGGEYQLCDGRGKGCGKGGCRRLRCGGDFEADAEAQENNKSEMEDGYEDSNTGG